MGDPLPPDSGAIVREWFTGKHVIEPGSSHAPGVKHGELSLVVAEIQAVPVVRDGYQIFVCCEVPGARSDQAPKYGVTSLTPVEANSRSGATCARAWGSPWA